MSNYPHPITKAASRLPISRMHYDPKTDTPTMRPGSTDAQACPSRIANTLYYKNGEVEHDPSSKTPNRFIHFIESL